jgi:hypothetical protein
MTDDLLELFGFGRALMLLVALVISLAALATAPGPTGAQDRAADALRSAAPTAARLR